MAKKITYFNIDVWRMFSLVTLFHIGVGFLYFVITARRRKFITNTPAIPNHLHWTMINTLGDTIEQNVDQG